MVAFAAVMGALVVSPLVASPLVAQGRGFDVDIAAGVAVTAGVLRSSGRRGGPLVRVGVLSRSHARPVRFRLEMEGFAVERDAERPNQQTADGIRVVSVNYSALFGPRRARVAPYAVAGLGLSIAQDRTPDAWPGVWTSARLGAGVRGRAGRVSLYGEIATVRVLRSLGAGAYVPIVLGVGF